MLEALRQMGLANLQVESILHVGANEGQERNDYEASGASPCLYVEPVDAAYAILEANLAGMPTGAGRHRAVQAVCSGVAGERVTFHVASNGGQSSSFLPLGAHATHHPSITYVGAQEMVTTTVDRIVAEHSPRRVPNLLVVDAQGADLRVLQGASASLPFVDGVFVEASEEPLYEGGCTHREITGFLEAFGLRLRWMGLDWVGHGEAFYARPRAGNAPLPAYGGNLALGKTATMSSECEWSYHDVAEGAQGGITGGITGRPGFHTGVEDAPWWQVDLEAVHPLNEVRLYNRMDSARERARTVRVLLSRDGEAWTLAHDQGGYTFGGADGRPLRVFLDGAPARYVRLQLAEHTYFHLDKVLVF